MKKFKKKFNFFLVLLQVFKFKINKKSFAFNPKKSNIPVLYINLKRSKKRNEVISNDLKSKFNFIYRIDAVDARDFIDGENFYKKNIKSISYDFNDFFGSQKTGLAVTLSHLIAIKKISDMNFDYSLVLEDDANLEYFFHWGINLKEIVEKAPKNFDIIKLHSRKNLQNLKLLNNNKLFRKIHQPVVEEVSSMALLWSKKGIKKTMSYMKNDEFKFTRRDSNKLVCDYLLYNINETYDFTQPLIYGNPFESLIGHQKPYHLERILMKTIYSFKNN
ncbi:MAG: glycosyltransferase family 25 protein [Flavobacteriaceae bacterium]